jgi:N-6 DNA Methylase
MFELIGKSIHARSPKQDLASIYDNAIIMLFRLLFIVYFEDKNQALLTKHHYYRKYSLQAIFDALDKSEPTQFDGFYALKNLFTILDEGAEDIDIPLFNGGLFDALRAPLLLPAKIFNNKSLRHILEQLLYKTNRGTTLFEHRRDYKNMSVTHLGRIYEGLLEFSFQISEENSVYLEYRIGNNPAVEAYFDTYDLANIQKQKGFVELRRQTVQKNGFVLKSNNNSRKSSASYYTPTSLSNYLVEAGIDYALSRENAKPLMDLKIIDNACGSGHFLVEALNYLTHLGVMRLADDVDLKKLVEEERDKINTQIQSLNIQDYEPEDAQILKRALLKRCIYGVDLNPFAVELARLSLWIDSFIFGTPLSFIEHHIQHGNALMGASEQAFADLRNQHFEETAQGSLDFDNVMESSFDGLEDAANKLNSLQDTSTADIKHSKEIYRNEVKPQLEHLARTLSFVSMCEIQAIEGDLDKNRQMAQALKLKRITFFEGDYLQSAPRSAAKRTLLAEIEAYQKQYVFFHYDVAFPEAREGFDVIIGNPPWDRTKFTDLDFFPYYHSNYRSLKKNEKQAIQNNLLEKPHIKAAYETKSRDMEVANQYYKNHFPLNEGSGDGNLFRFFVERNLSLLTQGGCLNYVLPSALMFEEGSQTLRQHILTQNSMPFFFSFENRVKLFIDVDSRYKFAMMQITNTPPAANASIRTAFYLSQPEELTPSRVVDYPLAALKALSPQQWAMMELRDTRDLLILQKCYTAFVPLSEQWLDFRRELDTANDKDLFIETDENGLLPLFEGNMIWQFSDKHEKAQYWLDTKAFDARLHSKEIYRMGQNLGLQRGECEAHHSGAVRYDREFYRLGCRKIASDTNERTLIFALMPKDCGTSDSMNISNPKNYLLQPDGSVGVEEISPLRLLFAAAWFNSVPCDWLARFMIQINVNKTYLMRLPLPQPSDYEILSHADYRNLAKNALLLTLSNSPQHFQELFTQLAPILNVSGNDIPQSKKAQDKLRYENDKLVANSYSISDEELHYILQSFNVMRNKRPEYVALFGE